MTVLQEYIQVNIKDIKNGDTLPKPGQNLDLEFSINSFSGITEIESFLLVVSSNKNVKEIVLPIETEIQKWDELTESWNSISLPIGLENISGSFKLSTIMPNEPLETMDSGYFTIGVNRLENPITGNWINVSFSPSLTTFIISDPIETEKNIKKIKVDLDMEVKGELPLIKIEACNNFNNSDETKIWQEIELSKWNDILVSPLDPDTIPSLNLKVIVDKTMISALSNIKIYGMDISYF